MHPLASWVPCQSEFHRDWWHWKWAADWMGYSRLSANTLTPPSLGLHDPRDQEWRRCLQDKCHRNYVHISHWAGGQEMEAPQTMVTCSSGKENLKLNLPATGAPLYTIFNISHFSPSTLRSPEGGNKQAWIPHACKHTLPSALEFFLAETSLTPW